MCMACHGNGRTCKTRLIKRSDKKATESINRVKSNLKGTKELNLELDTTHFMKLYNLNKATQLDTKYSM